MMPVATLTGSADSLVTLVLALGCSASTVMMIVAYNTLTTRDESIFTRTMLTNETSSWCAVPLYYDFVCFCFPAQKSEGAED